MAEAQPTTFAAKLIDLAALFQMQCGGFEVFVGSATYAPALTAPELSTGGGRQSVQHLKLKPSEGDGPTLVIGTVRQAAKTVELRSLEHMLELHAQRYKGASLTVDASTYAKLLEEATLFFEAKAFAVTVMEHPAPPATEDEQSGASRSEGTSPSKMLAMVGGAILVLALVAYLVIRH